MNLEFLKSVSGTLTVECTSAVPEKTLATITRAQIPLSHVEPKSELTYQFWIRRRDYHRLSEILHRQGDSLKIVQKRGFYWNLNSLFYHPVLIILFFLLSFSAVYLPSRVFFVSVEGNNTISDRLILDAAEDCGIRFGASRKEVRSEKVKNALLSAIPQLQWAGVNTSGCCAVISVRERIAEEQRSPANIVSNLISDRDGYILSATITSGTAHCLPGDVVTKGQLLISGYIDCGICLRATRAEGEILAQTNRHLKSVMQATYGCPKATGEIKYKVSLIIGKKRINLWKDSRIYHSSCGRMYQEYFVSLPGGFQLPVAICVDQYQYYEIEEALESEDHAQILLQQFSEAYMIRQMVAGQFMQKNHQIFSSDSLYQLESSYVCREMIGKEQREQIGVINGKRN